MLNIKKAEKIKTVDDQKPDDIGNVETYCSLTQAEYDELSEEEKNNGIVYYITDGSIEQIDASSVRYDNSNSHISSTSVQGALDSLDTMLGSIGSGELAELQEVLDDAQIALDSVQPIIPSSPGTAGQVLTKTSTGADWEDINALPSGGDTGQVLTKVSSTTGDVTWVTPKEGTVDAVNGISPDANKNVQIDVELTQAQYDALPSTKNSDNINYYITDGISNSEYNTISASGILYDNTDSGLTAATVQEAVDEITSLNSVTKINDPFEIVNTSVVQNIESQDSYLLVCGHIVYFSIRWTMKVATTGSTTAMKIKDNLSQYLPINYNNGNGVIAPCSETWTCASNGLIYINATWEVGLSGGLSAGKGYIASGVYFI